MLLTRKCFQCDLYIMKSTPTKLIAVCLLCAALLAGLYFIIEGLKH